MTYKVMTEASGSLAAAFLIENIQQAGFKAIASDISEENAGRYLADDFIQLPRISSEDLWSVTQKKVIQHGVDTILPSLDETLSDWSGQAWLNEEKITLVASPVDTLNCFLDKWQAYRFFTAVGIPTPKTSLEADYALVKPRFGRGGQGIEVGTQPEDMSGLISQEVASGIEYTVDVLCDQSGEPVYIIPRRRGGVVAGKSTSGLTENHVEIIRTVKKACQAIHFIGPVNFQCFVNEDGLSFIEVNPRISSGMALSFAATNNWIEQIVNHLKNGKRIESVPVRWGMKMYRYYKEVFV